MLADLLQAAPNIGEALKGLTGGGSTRVSTSVSNSLSVASNPVIVNSFGQGPVSANPSGSASGTPYSSSTASGNDGGGVPSYLPTTQPRITTPAYTSPSAVPGEGGAGDLLPVFLVGGLALFLLMQS